MDDDLERALALVPKLEGLLEKATPGDWELEEIDNGHSIRMGDAITSRGYHDSHNRLDYEHGMDRDDSDDPRYQAQCEQAEANAELIVEAKNALPTLLSALRTVEEERWQPIETAPKDGTPVDLWCDGIRLADCWWQDENPHFPSRPVGWICSANAGNPFALADIRAVPTHWRSTAGPSAPVSSIPSVEQEA